MFRYRAAAAAAAVHGVKKPGLGNLATTLLSNLNRFPKCFHRYMQNEIFNKYKLSVYLKYVDDYIAKLILLKN